jgi:uncharacterized OB-fold protein
VLLKGQNKFCSSACAAKVNNKRRTLHRKIDNDTLEAFRNRVNGKKCIVCGKDLHGMEQKYCKDCYDKKRKEDFQSKGESREREKTNNIPSITGIIDNKDYSQNHVCLECGCELSGNKTKFCSTKCKTKYYSRTYSYNTKYSRKRDDYGIVKKLELIKLKGGCCSSCGYDYNPSSLCFHHVDPSNKEFVLSSRNISRFDEETLLKEASKCILLCQNCHAELHHPQYNGVLHDINSNHENNI